MGKYIIIRQDVYEDIDDIEIIPGVFNSLNDAANKLKEIHDTMYDMYQVKLLPRDYLFCWKGYHGGGIGTPSYVYTKRIYFRIKEIQ